MADNEIKIPITVEGADKAARDVDSVAASTQRLGNTARTAAPALANTSSQVAGMGNSALAALAKTQQLVSGLSQVANVLGFGGQSIAGRVTQTSTAFAGLGAAFGPVGAAAGAVTGTLVGLLNALGPAAEAARTTAAALRELATINSAAQSRRTSRADNERQVELAQMALALASAGVTGEERANRIRERSLELTQERLRALENELPALAVAGTRQGLTDAARADANRRHTEALAEQNRLLAEQGRLQVEGINATVAATDATRTATTGTTPRSGGGGRNRRLDQKNKILDSAEAARETEETRAQAAYEAEIAAQMERQNASRQVADELMAREVQQQEGLAQLAQERRDFEIEVAMSVNEQNGIAMQRLELESQMAQLRSDGIDDAEQAVDFERIRLGLLRNSTRETQRQSQAAEASAQELGNYGSLLGQVFADAYGSAINGQKDFGAAFAESMKGILAQLGTRYIVEGAAALFQAIGFAASYQYTAAAGKAAEGAGLVALGAGLGAVGAAIPSASVTPTAPEKPESPDSGSGSEQNIQRTVVINYNSPVVTAGTRRQLGDQMSSLIRSGSR